MLQERHHSDSYLRIAGGDAFVPDGVLLAYIPTKLVFQQSLFNGQGHLKVKII